MFFARSKASFGWKRTQEQPGAVEDTGGTHEFTKKILRNISKIVFQNINIIIFKINIKSKYLFKLFNFIYLLFVYYLLKINIYSKFPN